MPVAPRTGHVYGIDEHVTLTVNTLDFDLTTDGVYIYIYMRVCCIYIYMYIVNNLDSDGVCMYVHIYNIHA